MTKIKKKSKKSWKVSYIFLLWIKYAWLSILDGFFKCGYLSNTEILNISIIHIIGEIENIRELLEMEPDSKCKMIFPFSLFFLILFFQLYLEYKLYIYIIYRGTSHFELSSTTQVKIRTCWKSWRGVRGSVDETFRRGCIAQVLFLPIYILNIYLFTLMLDSCVYMI